MSEIDVSKCKYYKMARCPEGYSCKYHCCNCYYKQLQQVIKDRDYYKQIVDGCKSENGNCSFCEIDKQLQQLKQENEELKKLNEQLATYYPQENNELLKVKTALDEIEKICKVNAINTCWTALNLCDKCKEKEECEIQSPFVKLDIIRNIIKQAKEGNDGNYIV